jgi:hypothetical protein
MQEDFVSSGNVSMPCTQDSRRGILQDSLNTLAGFISGIVGSKSVSLSKVANAVPDGCKTTSLEKRLARFVKNKNIDLEQYFLPFAKELLQKLPDGIMVFAIDGSVVGRGCIGRNPIFPVTHMRQNMPGLPFVSISSTVQP